MNTTLTLKQILIVQALAMIFLGTIFDSIVRGAIDRLKEQSSLMDFNGREIHQRILEMKSETMRECNIVILEQSRYVDGITGGVCLNVR